MLIFLVKECFVCGRCFGDHNLECDLDKTLLNATLLGLPIIENRYRLDKRISTEPYGTSYLAYDIENKSAVTLKLILIEYLRDGFEKYSVILENIRQIEHPNIITIFDYGKIDNTTCFIAMEYLDWNSLDKTLKEQKFLSLELAINSVSLLCEVVNAIYDSGQMYQDIKLTNIFISNNLKLCYLGLSPSLKFKSGAVLELPYYISPEQCKNLELDERSEVYSIGILLYHLLTGKLPFSGQNYITIAEQHIRQVPVDPKTLRPEIPNNVSAIILRALEKDPDKRFQTVLAFANLLRQAFRQANKSINLDLIAVEKPSTEKLAIAQTSPKELIAEAKNLRTVPSLNQQIDEQEDENRTVEVTRFESVSNSYSYLNPFSRNVDSLEEDASLTKEEAQELISDLAEIEQTKAPKPKRFSTINIGPDVGDDNLKELEKKYSPEDLNTIGNMQTVVGMDNSEILTILSSKLAEKTYPLPSEVQDGTKPLPPELQALFNASLSQANENSQVSEKNISKDTILEVKEVEEVTKKDDLNKNVSVNTSTPELLSPAQVSYFYADKLLPAYKPGQYQRNIYDGIIVEREALASLSLVLGIFSLKRRKCFKIVAIDKIPPVLQKKLTLAEDDKVVLQLINAGVKPLDSLEQSILKSFGRVNAISFYSVYEYFFIVADQQKISTSELINDALADDLTEKKVLKTVPRDSKVLLEPGGSIRSYVVSTTEKDSYLSQQNELTKFIEGLKKEVTVLEDGSQTKVYSYMLDYYKRLLCQHSYTFER